MTATSPFEPTGSAAGPVVVPRRDYHRVRYEGPLELLGTVVKTFRNGGVMLASVCVEGSPVQVPGSGRAALALLCQGSLQSIASLVDDFAQEFAPEAGLVLAD